MNIGKTIAELRKANNMTQSEVADILGVSYQAVSKWERNESLPDITLLPKIADLYHISIDQLLRGSSEMKEEEIQAATGIVEEALKDDFSKTDDQKIAIEDADDETDLDISDSFTAAFESMAPFLKPKKIKKMLRGRNVRLASFSSSAYEYMDSDTITQLIDSIDALDEDTFEKLIDLLPLCNTNLKDRIISLIEDSDLSDLDVSAMLPFLNKDQMNTLIKAYLEQAKRDEAIEKLEEFLPFLNHEGKDIVMDFLLEGSLDEMNLEIYMPFLNSDHKDRLVFWITSQDEVPDLDEILPFLNSLQKKELLAWAEEYLDLDELSVYACFMNKDIISHMVKKYIDDESDEDFSEFYPFMDKESKKALFNYYLEKKMNDELMELLSFMK